MTTTAYEDAIADAQAEVTTLVADSWPIVVTIVLSFLGFKIFRRVTK